MGMEVAFLLHHVQRCWKLALQLVQFLGECSDGTIALGFPVFLGFRREEALWGWALPAGSLGTTKMLPPAWYQGMVLGAATFAG